MVQNLLQDADSKVRMYFSALFSYRPVSLDGQSQKKKRWIGGVGGSYHLRHLIFLVWIRSIHLYYKLARILKEHHVLQVLAGLAHILIGRSKLKLKQCITSENSVPGKTQQAFVFVKSLRFKEKKKGLLIYWRLGHLLYLFFPLMIFLYLKK